MVIGFKKKLVFSTNSLAELLPDSLLLESCSLSQPITFIVVVWVNQSDFVSLLVQIFPFFHNLAILFFSEMVMIKINW